MLKAAVSALTFAAVAAAGNHPHESFRGAAAQRPPKGGVKHSSPLVSGGKDFDHVLIMMFENHAYVLSLGVFTSPGGFPPLGVFPSLGVFTSRCVVTSLALHP